MVATSPDNRRLQIIEVVLVLAVAFSASIVGSLIVFVTGAPLANHYDDSRLAMSICSELSALALLAYVLFRQGKTWRNLTKSPKPKDILRGLFIVIVSGALYALTYYIIEISAFALTHAWIRPKSLNDLLAVGFSVLSLAFMLINPFFEELIVRAYLMTEVRALGGTRAVAVLISIALQVSYHLYQGWLNAALSGVIFLLFSIYYVRTNRIGPVILAHMFYDVGALVHHALRN
jgi:membrane protease YdiL (CAAX protease family)